MYAKKEPFKVTEKELKEYVVDGDFRPQLPDDVPREIARLIRACWQKDPTMRPAIDEVLRVCRPLVP